MNGITAVGKAIHITFKIALAALSLFILFIVLYIVLIFDWRPAVAALPLFIPLILFFVAWCLPERMRKKIIVTGCCIGLATLVALISVVGVIVYEHAITIDDNYSSDISYTSRFTPFEDIPKIQASVSFESDAPHILVSNSFYRLTANFIAATYPRASFDNYGESTYLSLNRSPDFLLDGTVDILIERDHTDEDFYNLEPENTEWTPIARDSLVIFTHKDNPVKNLTKQQLTDICTGKITNWSEVGGENIKIELYTSHNLTCANDLLEKYIGAPLAGYVTERRLAFPYLAFPEYPLKYRNTRGAIGFNFLSDIDARYKNTHAIAIDGVYADIETVSQNSYPICEDVCAVTLKDRSEAENKLIDWILSDEGQAIVKKCGYASVK